MKPVVCAGIIVADHVSSPLHHLPAEGELIIADHLRLTLGGCAANVATNLHRLGVPCQVTGRVGDDPFGELTKSLLAREGLDTSGIITTPGCDTSQTLIVNVAGQDRRFIHTYGANALFRASDIPTDPVPEILYLGGYLLMSSCLPKDLAPVLRRARANGSKVVLDVVTPKKADYIPWLEPVLPHVDYFLPNDHEAELITGLHDAREQARMFRSMGAGNAIITMGERGTLWAGARGTWSAGIDKVEYLDGSGSGDAFAAGLIHALLRGMDEPEALRVASAVGASCVRALGTTAGVFTRVELDAFVAAHHLPVAREG